MNLTHHFLLAMPGLSGDYFDQTLTYICEHNEDGALGIMINRPSTVTLLELLAQLNLPTARKWAEVVVLEGGPVSVERGFVLHGSEQTFESSSLVSDGLYLATGLDVLEAIATDRGPERFLVALGYAGWGAGQLEQEIRNNIWLTCEADPQIIFETEHDDRLKQAAEQLGVDLSLVAGRAGNA